MEFTLGIFVVPDATNAASTVAQIIEAERSGLDVVGVQDHPSELMTKYLVPRRQLLDGSG